MNEIKRFILILKKIKIMKKKIKIPKIIKAIGIVGLLIIAGGSAKKVIDKQIKSMEKDIREKDV
jgi:membrane-associated protease RseP (regulator of RpoE activity)